MHLTQAHKEAILQKLREENRTNDELAQAVGKSSPWVTKILKSKDEGGIANIKDIDAERIEDFLGFSLVAVHSQWSPYSDSVTKFADMAEENPAMRKVISALLEMQETKCPRPRYIDTNDISTVGKEIYDLAMNLDRDDEGHLKYGKLARQILNLLG